jgi:hypothetical protein
VPQRKHVTGHTLQLPIFKSTRLQEGGEEEEEEEEDNFNK